MELIKINMWFCNEREGKGYDQKTNLAFSNSQLQQIKSTLYGETWTINIINNEVISLHLMIYRNLLQIRWQSSIIIHIDPF